MGIFDEINSLDDSDEESLATYKHAPLKYCGNKHSVLDKILPHLPYLDSFVDVCAGSGVVLFSRKRSPLEVYNDRHGGVAAFYRVLQNRTLYTEFFERLEFLQHSRELFYAFKDEYLKQDQSLVDRALKFYYTLQVSFGGKNLEFGRVKKGRSDLYNKITAYWSDFEYFHERLKGVQIENLDLFQCIKDFDSYTTVAYIDPPYWDSNQYLHTMTKADHARMCDLVFQSKGFYALSGYENPVYDSMPWDQVHVYEVRENFQPSGQDKKRSEVRKEFLWIKEAG